MNTADSIQPGVYRLDTPIANPKAVKRSHREWDAKELPAAVYVVLDETTSAIEEYKVISGRAFTKVPPFRRLGVYLLGTHSGGRRRWHLHFGFYVHLGLKEIPVPPVATTLAAAWRPETDFRVRLRVAEAQGVGSSDILGRLLQQGALTQEQIEAALTAELEDA